MMAKSSSRILGMALVEDPQADSCGTGVQQERLRTPEVASRWYRAPELLFGSSCYDSAVDIWAAGCIFAEMLGMGPLFAGATDIEQLLRVVEVLGPPHLATWPQLSSLPDYGKIAFAGEGRNKLLEVLPDAPPNAASLLSMFLQYNPVDRPSAATALLQPYFTQPPLPASPSSIAAFIRKHVSRPKALQGFSEPFLQGPCPCPSCILDP
eukprot:jgi/Botrbrau1/16024/Bobra.0268s0006.1